MREAPLNGKKLGHRKVYINLFLLASNHWSRKGSSMLASVFPCGKVNTMRHPKCQSCSCTGIMSICHLECITSPGKTHATIGVKTTHVGSKFGHACSAVP